MFNDYYAKVNDDYRREVLARAWRPRRRLLPQRPAARRRHATA